MILSLDIGFKVMLQVTELSEIIGRESIHNGRTVRRKKVRFQSLKFNSLTFLIYVSELSVRSLTGKLPVMA